MGSGIALLLAARGLDVQLAARSRASLDGARARIDAALDFLSGEGWMAGQDTGPARRRVTTTTDLDAALASADLVLEAVTEEALVKREVYRRIGERAPANALVASTTSGLNIFEIAAGFPHPERLCIAHFWNPPYLVPLVEVVVAPGTPDAAVREMEQLLREWGCTPVRLSRYVPGFIGVRLNSALYREAVDLIASGVIDASGIDAVMRDSIALRFPVLDAMQVVDFGGLDTFARVWAQSFPLISASPDVPAFVGEAVSAGRHGLKSGRGFYDYQGQAAEDLLRERDRRLLRWLRERDRYRLGAATEPSMRRTKIAAPEFGLRTGAFSNAYSVEVGDAVIIHTAGHLAVDASGVVVGSEDTARQAEHIYGVIEGILHAAGATLDHVVKTTAYLSDIRDYPAVNEVRNRVFAGREPASTIVEVSKFVHPGAKIEIEAVAIRPRA
jgi:3-hydroxybutyryl-CoA dehydrogenase